MANDLIEAADLEPFGPTVDAALIDAAVAALRSDVGWHIAPEVTETVLVESNGGRFIFLPTMHLVSVESVTDVTTSDAPVTLSDWRELTTARFSAGVLEKVTGWPCGVLEVEMTHGYETCPPDLLMALSERCRTTSRADLTRWSVDDMSETYRGGMSSQSQSVVANYRIPRVT